SGFLAPGGTSISTIRQPTPPPDTTASRVGRIDKRRDAGPDRPRVWGMTKMAMH
ncbi:MAG: hypothetical protein QOI56_1732, partial [Actinomycetota bacterium]|nr:hypothetical protein [Actinomycetota bacterium]